MTSTALAVVDGQIADDLTVRRPPETVLDEAHKAAAALKRVLEAKPRKVMFGGEQYLEFEDWQTIGRFYGVTAKVVDTARIDVGTVRGFTARAVAIRADGFELSAAESECLTDEPNWANKPSFQLKSMAQTRACGKALRNVLAWVVVLAGYRPTPAEEMDQAASTAQAAAGTTTAPAGATGQPVAEGLRVKSVARKSGTTRGKAWTRGLVTFSDNSSGVTFDTKLIEQAEAAQASQIPVQPNLNTTDKGVDFVGWRPMPAAAPPVEPIHPDEPVNGPEKVLTVRKLTTDKGDRFEIQTEKRRLLTDQEAFADQAVDARKSKAGILPTFDVIQGASGPVNRLTGLQVVASTADRQPGEEG